MNWIDLCLIAVVGLSTLKGYRSGLIRQASALVAIVIAGFLCSKLAGLFEHWVISSFEMQPRTARFFSLIFSFTGILTAIRYTGSLIHRSVRHTPLAFINRLAGAILSPAIVLLLFSYLFILIDTLFPITPKGEERMDIRVESRFYLPVQKIVPAFFVSSGQLPNWENWKEYFPNNASPEEKRQANPSHRES